nr:small heat shock protein sHsp16.04 [Dinophyceae sp.]
MDLALVPRGFSGFPIEEFVGGAPFNAGLGGFQRFERLFGGLQGLDQVVGSDTFKVETTGGHFKLRASLPGYSIAGAAGAMQDGQKAHPLSVEVVGRSLVVRGQKAEGQMITSFQRSFQLPRVADADRISAVYKDGVLAVDVPASSKLPEN